MLGAKVIETYDNDLKCLFSVFSGPVPVASDTTSDTSIIAIPTASLSDSHFDTCWRGEVLGATMQQDTHRSWSNRLDRLRRVVAV